MTLVFRTWKPQSLQWLCRWGHKKKYTQKAIRELWLCSCPCNEIALWQGNWSRKAVAIPYLCIQTHSAVLILRNHYSQLRLHQFNWARAILLLHWLILCQQDFFTLIQDFFKKIWQSYFARTQVFLSREKFTLSEGFLKICLRETLPIAWRNTSQNMQIPSSCLSSYAVCYCAELLYLHVNPQSLQLPSFILLKQQGPILPSATGLANDSPAKPTLCMKTTMHLPICQHTQSFVFASRAHS